MKRHFSRVWAALLAVALLADAFAAASAAPPKADAPAFTVSVSADGKTLVLTPVPPLKFRVMSMSPNAASGVAPVIVNGVADFIDWKLSVVFGEGPNPPPVPPVPPPVPPPPPVPTTLFGIVIEESKGRTPAQAIVLLSPKVEALFKAGDGRLEIADPWDDTGAIRDLGPGISPYVKRSIDLKVRPAFFVVDPKGNVFFEGKLPAKVEDVEGIIGKIRKGVKP